ncbi:MAG: hypothetical protein AABY26_00240 [Nanoarchaeota archaeon]
MKCELKDTFNFDGKFCRTLLPERAMFQHFGLEPQPALKASLEYFAGAGYIYFGNVQRDSFTFGGKVKGWSGKQIVKPFMPREVRRVVYEADKNIGIYEANDADFSSYLSLVEKCGKDFYSAIVANKKGEVQLAGEFGGVLASLTSLEDMLSNRENDLAGGRYNPLKTEAELTLAKEMFGEYRQQSLRMLGEVLNDERLQRETILHQGKIAFDYLLTSKGRGITALAATVPFTTGCACQDIANVNACGENASRGGITCGGIAVALVIGYLCCKFCPN